MKYSTEINTNVSGYSPSIHLEPGMWNIFVSADTWSGGTSILQTSHNNVRFFNLQGSSGVVSFTEDGIGEINGGLILRVNNSTNISGFYLVAKNST